MDGDAVVAAGDVFQSDLEGTGDAGLADDVHCAKGSGDEHRTVDQVVGQSKGGDANDAVLFVPDDQDSPPAVRFGGEMLAGKAPPALKLCRRADGADEGECTVDVPGRKQTCIEFPRQSATP